VSAYAGMTSMMPMPTINVAPASIQTAANVFKVLMDGFSD
jgi:hypothetical protein